MIRLIELRYGTKKKIPQLIMVASSLEDIVVVVIFSLVLALVEAHVATPEGLSALAIIGQVPMALISGIVLGFIGGFILSFIAKRMSKGDELLPGTVTLILTILIAASFVMVAIGNWFKPYAAVSGLLAVMIMSSVVKGQVSYELGQALNRQINQLWIPIEIILFVLVGAAIDTTYMLSMSGILIGIIALGLIARMFGVGISLMKTVLSTKESLYCAISFAPKATVQAAIGGIPLALGLDSGPLVLAASAMAILITSPIGAFGMDYFYKRLLEPETDPIIEGQGEAK